MALNMFGQPAPASNVRPMPQANQQRDPATKWLNVGMTIPLMQDDGTIVDTFVTVLGIPLDSVQMPEFRGNSQAYHQVVTAKQAMLRAILGEAEKLEAGTDTPVVGLEIQIRKVGEKTDPAPTEASASILDLISKRMAAAK